MLVNRTFYQRWSIGQLEGQKIKLQQLKGFVFKWVNLCFNFHKYYKFWFSIKKIDWVIKLSH